jgi:hypothetical protein
VTVVVHIPLLIEEIRAEGKVNCPPAAAREFAIAITALEDAQMRHYRGMVLKGVMMDEVEFIERKIPEGTIFAADALDLAGSA